VLTVRGIRSHLDENGKVLRPEVFVRVDSTNTKCIEKAEQGEGEGYVAVAGSQSAGRGRRGKSFFSPAESGIYMSILFRPEGLTENQVLHFTTMAAAAVSEAIEAVSGKKAEIKWVNDIFIGGKKVCGILSEASYGIHTGKLEYVIVGIGINAYEPSGGFPSAIADVAGCVFDEPSAGLKNRLAAEVLNRFMAYYEHLPDTPYSEEYIRRSMVTGKDVTVHKGSEMINAHVLGIDQEFGLKVRYDDGSVEILRSGEVSIRI
jgi:BirA family biotin operon repressor/biotin-[acetyl-CoA-carboxylase] ligase